GAAIELRRARRVVAALSGVDADGADAVDLEPRIDLARPPEAAQEQPRGDERHRRERHLGDDEGVAEEQPASALAGAPRLLLERADDGGARRLERGDQAEDDAGDERDHGGE